MSNQSTREERTSEVATADADEFASLLKVSFRPRSEREGVEVDNAIATLVEQAMQGSTVLSDDVVSSVEEMIARLDAKISAQLNEVVHAEEFQSVESAWRGLHHLVYNSETDTTLKIAFMNVSKKELQGELRRYPGAKWDQSPLFKKVYEAEFGQLGGSPYGCLVGDYYFDHSAADVQLLADMGRIAAAAHAPFITGAAPTLLRMDDWSEVNNPREIANIFETPDYARWKSLRDSPNSRYVGLCMPRVLARDVYGPATTPSDGFVFQEETDGHDGSKYTWMNAAYAMAVNINRAHKEYGWTVKIRGVNSGGEVENLPTFTFATDDGGVDLKCPTEVAIPDRREAELSKMGLLPLIHRKNTDKAAFIGAQSLYRPKKYDDERATASDNISSRLPYMFAISRFAHYLKCMVRDQIGQTRERQDLENWLQSWINDYVDTDPRNSDERSKAERPLAEASVEVFTDEENPGYYSARFLLRPHFQLEGMDIGLSLVSKLDGPKG